MLRGNFQTFPKKRLNLKNNSQYYNIGYGIHLSLSIKDRDLLKQIHLNLNSIGNYYEYPHRDEVRISITKLEDIKWLIENVMDKSPLLTKHQRNKYSRLRFGVLSKFNRVENLEEYQEFLTRRFDSELSVLSNIETTDKIAFDNWMSGFINGEGSFHIHANGHLIFYIEQVDSEVLDLIRTRLNANPKVLFRAGRGDNHKDTYSLSLSSKKDIKSLVDFFNGNNTNLIPLAGNKKIQFDEWIAFYHNSGKYL